MPKLTCFQGQRFLIGEHIAVTINAIYKKRDGMRCVALNIEVPSEIRIYQERMAQLPTELLEFEAMNHRERVNPYTSVSDDSDNLEADAFRG